MARTLEELKVAREDALADHERRRESLGLREDEPFEDPAFTALLNQIDDEISALG